MFDDHADAVNMLLAEHCGVDALNARLQGEAEAVALMDACGGNPDAEMFRAFCAAWNRECFDRAGVRREITCTRFGTAYVEAAAVAEHCGGTPFSSWLEAFWNAPPPDDAVLPAVFAGYQAVQVPGAGPFLLSLLLYLRDPEHRYPYTRSLASALATLQGDCRPLGEACDPVTYAAYCAGCDALRETFNTLPQEVDFILRSVAEGMVGDAGGSCGEGALEKSSGESPEGSSGKGTDVAAKAAGKTGADVCFVRGTA